MEEARELQLTARRCTNPCSDSRMSRAFARFKARMVENIVRAGISREDALERMRKMGEFEEPRCAIIARETGGTCVAHKPALRHCYEWRLKHFESESGAILEASNYISVVVWEIFISKLRQEGAIFGIESPNNMYNGAYLFPTNARRIGAFLDNGHYDAGICVLRGAISHAVMARALGLDVLYVRAKRHGARIEFEPLCDLERIRGKRTLVIEDDLVTGRTIRKVVSELRGFVPAAIDIGLFSNINPRVGETFMGYRVAYDSHKVMYGERGRHCDSETEYAAIVRLLDGLRQ